MDEHGWRPASKEEADRLVKELDLVKVFHSVADTSLWYIRSDADGCKNYMELTPYIRRNELYNDGPEDGFFINERNVQSRAARRS